MPNSFTHSQCTSSLPFTSRTSLLHMNYCKTTIAQDSHPQSCLSNLSCPPRLNLSTPPFQFYFHTYLPPSAFNSRSLPVQLLPTSSTLNFSSFACHQNAPQYFFLSNLYTSSPSSHKLTSFY